VKAAQLCLYYKAVNTTSNKFFWHRMLSNECNACVIVSLELHLVQPRSSFSHFASMLEVCSTLNLQALAILVRQAHCSAVFREKLDTPNLERL